MFSIKNYKFFYKNLKLFWKNCYNFECLQIFGIKIVRFNAKNYKFYNFEVKFYKNSEIFLISNDCKIPKQSIHQKLHSVASSKKRLTCICNIKCRDG